MDFDTHTQPKTIRATYESRPGHAAATEYSSRAWAIGGEARQGVRQLLTDTDRNVIVYSVHVSRTYTRYSSKAN
ncbi:hypothetical protein Cob_v003956 [Colletotrichum orbiculare MAFF 240422]|uniref:Uncharacterized protein n=1 Tax=Colletotrichum orbiculare (strain 104-T / ATCC 96160 / CBS 514.97 / LARS 414 / MAFF 240422) TaxID=1213857 RepID=A0A484G0V9_COLOR|nr:hypothetical protein Cob_v003956 [Colletotrichum orbiculare MAFF 240422]